MTWSDLTQKQKDDFKIFCDDKFGIADTFVETGEPIYFDEDLNLIDTSMIIDLLFNYNIN